MGFEVHKVLLGSISKEKHGYRCEYHQERTEILHDLVVSNLVGGVQHPDRRSPKLSEKNTNNILSTVY
jgi:hypothetical protein